MIALLDAGIIRHIEYQGLPWPIRAFSETQGWAFMVPEAVMRELEAGGTSSVLRQVLAGLATASCTDFQIAETLARLELKRLGAGELEAISIVDHREDGELEDYVILTDDEQAQKAAGRLGIGSLDIMQFILLANESGLLGRDEAVGALEFLEKNKKYRSGKTAWRDFLNRVRQPRGLEGFAGPAAPWMIRDCRAAPSARPRPGCLGPVPGRRAMSDGANIRPPVPWPGTGGRA